MNPRLRSVVRSSVLAVNTPMAKSRAGKAFAAAPRPLKLEVGGLTPRAGWLVTNVNATAKLYLDASATWPIEDAAAQYVYADNVIEHLTLTAGRTLIAQAFRVLQPGGTIRLVTPDLRKHIDAYLAGAESVRSDLAAAYRDIGLQVEHPADIVRIPIASFGHHTGFVYDAAALTAELQAAGFTDVVEYAMGESGVADLRGLDQRTDEGPAQMALEAVKPG